MIRSLLRAEGLRSGAVVGAGLLLGWWLVTPLWGLLASVGGLLAYHLWQANRLLHWSRSPKQYELPTGSGIWEEIFNSAYSRYKLARKRKKRLGDILGEFRASTAALPDAAVVLDSAGQIVWYNVAAGRLFGFLSTKDLGQRVNNLLRHPRFVGYFQSDPPDEAGVEIPSPNEPENTLWVRLIPYGREQMLLIARDVTAFKRLEQSRRDFVANASHELRTPLTVVRGYLDMMGEEATPEGPLGPWHAPLTEMRRQAARMQKIIADLLKLANLEVTTGQPKAETVDMPAMLRGAVEELEALSANQHRIEAHIAEDLHLSGSQSELYSIVSNLCSNALRYTPQGGQISLSWRETGGRALLIVKDSGIGISARDLPRLTERFYRADIARSRETGGTGLGLAIVKHALERHEGKLRISSTLGKGSVFTCEFPSQRIAKPSRLAHAS